MTIKILIVHEDDGETTELADIKISRLQPTYDEATWADYSITFAYHDEEMHVKQRHITDFPRKHLNVLGLIKHALAVLTPEELTFNGELPPGHMARGQHRAVPEVPPRED